VFLFLCFIFYPCFVTIFALLRCKNTAKTSKGRITFNTALTYGAIRCRPYGTSFVSNKFETPFKDILPIDKSPAIIFLAKLPSDSPAKAGQAPFLHYASKSGEPHPAHTPNSIYQSLLSNP